MFYVCTFNVLCMHCLVCWEESFHFFGVWSGFISGLMGLFGIYGVYFGIMGFMGFLCIFMYLYQVSFCSFSMCLVCLVLFECGGRIRGAGSGFWPSQWEVGGVFCGFRRDNDEVTMSIYVPLVTPSGHYTFLPSYLPPSTSHFNHRT